MMQLSQMALRELRKYVNEAVWANKTVCGKWDYEVECMVRAGWVRGEHAARGSCRCRLPEVS